MRRKINGTIVLLLAFGLLFAVSGYKAAGIVMDARREAAVFEELRLYPQAALEQENPDFFGWVRIGGTRLDYPVMYTPDDPEYYLHRDFDGEEATGGVPFVGEGWQEDGNHTIVYGHNMKDGSMFATLLSYAGADFAAAHPFVSFETAEGRKDYRVLGAFYSEAYEQTAEDVFRYYEYQDLSEREEFNTYVELVRQASLYDTGVYAPYGGELLTLSTCSYHTGDGRFVVVAYSAD